MSNSFENKIQNWIESLVQNSRDFQNQFSNLSADKMNHKWTLEEWSIAQNIDHLIAVSKSYFPTFEALKAGDYKRPLLSKIKFLVKVTGDSILKSVNPNRKKKMPTFPIWEPTLSNFGPSIVDDLERTQKRLIEYVKESTPFLEQNIVIASPANRNVVYTLEKAFDIIIAHQKRHFNQAMEMLQLQEQETNENT